MAQEGECTRKLKSIKHTVKIGALLEGLPALYATGAHQPPPVNAAARGYGHMPQRYNTAG